MTDITREQRIAQAREVLDWLEKNPDYPLPTEFTPWDGVFDSFLWGSAEYQRDELAKRARLLGNTVKYADEHHYGVVKAFPSGAGLAVKGNRDKTCTARVVGKKTTKKRVQIVEPVWEEQEVTEDVIEWDCEPVLRGAK